jgi:hypothetical protein
LVGLYVIGQRDEAKKVDVLKPREARVGTARASADEARWAGIRGGRLRGLDGRCFKRWTRIGSLATCENHVEARAGKRRKQTLHSAMVFHMLIQ